MKPIIFSTNRFLFSILQHSSLSALSHQTLTFLERSMLPSMLKNPPMAGDYGSIQ